MTPVIFVLIKTDTKREQEVYKAIENVPEVTESHPLLGEYDFIAKIEADDYNLLGDIVVDKVRTIDGVLDTRTLTGIKF
ncbi:MAG: Lrp/AsnC ligand binding domain-containing protein [Candidatus Hodarchaeales archaeon]|jgi:DNA-binding Lrp family transcriptional regulator